MIETLAQLLAQKLISLSTKNTVTKDDIAVIVNNDNDLEELSSDQVKSIFTVDITDWEDVFI